MTESKDELRGKLADLNQQIAELGGEADAVYEQVGGEGEGAQNPEDVAAALTNAQENEAILATLYARRDRLHEQLGE